METKYLEYILEIAKHKSITRAAQSLYVTQSSLSQYLIKLEGEIGTPLFTRAKNELIPTDAGVLYIQAAKAAVRLKKSLYENISALRNEGTISLGISSQWGVKMAVDVLEAFKRQYPRVTLKIYEQRYNRLKDMLLSGKLDMAVMAALPDDDIGVPFETLRREELVLAAAEGEPLCLLHQGEEPIAYCELVSLLRGCSFILSDAGSTIRACEDKLFAGIYFKPDVICELNSNSATLQMVSRGIGVAIVPAGYAENFAGVKTFSLEPPLLRKNILALGREKDFSEPEKYLLSLIRAHPLFSKNS